MDRGEVLLNSLRHKLEGWTPTIRRSVYARAVTILPQPRGEFVVRVEWVTKGGETKTFERAFTRKGVFGASYSRGHLNWHVERKSCDYARELIQQVLNERGV